MYTIQDMRTGTNSGGTAGSAPSIWGQPIVGSYQRHAKPCHREVSAIKPKDACTNVCKTDPKRIQTIRYHFGIKASNVLTE